MTLRRRQASRRSAQIVLGLGAVALFVTPLAPAAAAPMLEHTIHVRYTYWGEEIGDIKAVGKINSFKPPVVYRTIDWAVEWRYTCVASATVNNISQKGTQVF